MKEFLLPKLDLNAEAVLDPGIRPEELDLQWVSEPGSIFLTGATGFLGAFLLRELLEQTRAKIYCLVRCADNLEEGKERIKKNLEFHQVWSEALSHKIIPVVGDLSQLLFGLGAKEFNKLASKIDVIYHCGALVKWTRTYQQHKAINVLGTQEILRLATHLKLKPVHYISTMSALGAFNSSQVIREQNILDEKEFLGFDSGYVRSKWVAEKLVKKAGIRGLPICIYRLFLTGASSQTGILNTSDFFIAKMIKGCIQLGLAPELDWTLDMTPVDYQAQAIVYISRQKKSLGKTFNPLNTNPVEWPEIVNWTRSFGYPIQQQSREKWVSELSNQAKSVENNALYKFLPMFLDGSMDQLLRKRNWNCENFLNALEGSNISCPPIDEKMRDLYFNYFIKHGFLEAPLVRT